MKLWLVLAALAIAACGTSSLPLPGCVPPAAKPGVLQNCFQGRIAVDSRSYSPGGAVKITETATNACSSPAGAPSACGARGVYVTSAGGKIVWTEPQMGIVCPALAILVQPGASVSYSTTWPIPADQARGGYSAVGPPNYGSAGFAVC